MVQEAVRDNFNLQKDLIIQVATFGDPAEALTWAEYYGIGREYWPHNLRLYQDNPEYSER